MDRQVDDKHVERRNEKRVLLGVFAMALIAVLLVGGTLAYFTNSSTAEATFGLEGGTKVELLNSWNSANGKGAGGVGLYPGDSVNDTIIARNAGSDCYLRIRMRVVKNKTVDGNEEITTDNVGSYETVDDLGERARAADEVAADNTTLNDIVGTLYNDTTFSSKVSDGLTNGSGTLTAAQAASNGLYRSVITPTQSAREGVANVMSLGDDYASRTSLIAATDAAGVDANRSYRYSNATTGNRLYGYVANRLSAYRDTREAARSAALANNVLLGDFINVTTATEYRQGLLTFEYVGGSDGVLPAAALSKPLITTVCLTRADYVGALFGGVNADGETVGYTITTWAESVPAADFTGTSDTAEARRVEAMKQLDDYFKAESYYPGVSS